MIFSDLIADIEAAVEARRARSPPPGGINGPMQGLRWAALANDLLAFCVLYGLKRGPLPRGDQIAAAAEVIDRGSSQRQVRVDNVDAVLAAVDQRVERFPPEA